MRKKEIVGFILGLLVNNKDEQLHFSDTKW